MVREKNKEMHALRKMFSRMSQGRKYKERGVSWQSRLFKKWIDYAV